MIAASLEKALRDFREKKNQHGIHPDGERVRLTLVPDGGCLSQAVRFS